PNPCFQCAIATGEAGLETSEVRQPARRGRWVANRALAPGGRKSLNSMHGLLSWQPLSVHGSMLVHPINPAPERGHMRDYSSADVGDQLKRIGPS
ncbi:hypothetical protein BO82DRAFT_293212, partial [Aspergillus uvarum CBS 121591]